MKNPSPPAPEPGPENEAPFCRIPPGGFLSFPSLDGVHAASPLDVQPITAVQRLAMLCLLENTDCGDCGERKVTHTDRRAATSEGWLYLCRPCAVVRILVEIQVRAAIAAQGIEMR